jgi:hypothetical protein
MSGYLYTLSLFTINVLFSLYDRFLNIDHEASSRDGIAYETASSKTWSLGVYDNLLCYEPS